MSASLHLYHKMPAFAQNILLTGYGWLQYRQRYSRCVRADASTDADYLSHQQQVSLGILLAHAEKYVPYYRRLFKRIGISAAEINVANLREVLPVLEKESVVEKPEEFYSEYWLKKGVWLHTSGTSGSPLSILATPFSRKVNYWFYRYLLNRFSVDIRDRSVTFAGRLIVRPEQSKKFWRVDQYTRTMYCSSYHLSDANMPAYIREIERWNPIFIDSYPSAIGSIASYIRSHSLRTNIRPRLIFTSSETLTDQQRSDIEEAFECPVLDQYGCTEMAVMAWSAGARYKVEPMYGVAELEPIGGGAHSLLCTGLLNEAMPLIRYRIGDTVSGVSDLDSKLPLQFDRIEGRVDDLIRTPEGLSIGRLDPAFKGIEGVKNAQIIQTALDHLSVRIVFTRRAEVEKIKVVLAQNLQQRTSPLMKISFEETNVIPLEPSGKFKSVISRIS